MRAFVLCFILVLLSFAANSQVSALMERVAPCFDCHEKLPLRTDSSSYFVDNQNENKFYLVYYPDPEKYEVFDTEVEVLDTTNAMNRATVTSTNAAVLGGGALYNPSCAAILACTYTLTVATPANSTITDIRFSLSYITGGGCWMGDAIFDIRYLGCINPSWGCAVAAGGTCTGTNLSLLPELTPCIPAPSCAPYNMVFSLDWYRTCFGPVGCPLACIIPSTPWSIVIEGETVDNTTLAGGAATSIAVPCSTDVLLDAGAIYGVPTYDYLWSNGATSATQIVNLGINGTYTYSVLVTDACGQTTTSSVDVVVSGCSATLPVEIVHLEAFNEPFGNRIKWETLSETNNDYFILQRSMDGLNWTDLATIEGAGNSSEKQYYSYFDERPLHGNNYYRLKQVDFDGVYAYSDVVNVDLRNSFVIYPNPANEKFTLIIEEDHQLPLSVIIEDLQGKVVNSVEMTVNYFEIDVSALPKGMYFVKIYESGTLFSYRKLVLQN